MKNFLWGQLDFLTEKSHTMFDVLLIMVLCFWVVSSSVNFFVYAFLLLCIFILSDLIDALVRPRVVAARAEARREKAAKTLS